MTNRMEFNIEIAEKCGLRESVLATYLWDLLDRDDVAVEHHGRYWTRISQKMITVALPFMTVDMLQGSLLKLLKKGIIKTAVFNEDKFDHTNWYTFTDYGIEMMDPGNFA